MRETRATRKYNKGQGSKGEAGIQKQHCYSGGTYVERSLQIRLRAAVKTAGSKGRPTEAPGQEQPGTPSGVTPIHTGHLLTTAPKPYSKERERERRKSLLQATTTQHLAQPGRRVSTHPSGKPPGPIAPAALLNASAPCTPPHDPAYAHLLANPPGVRCPSYLHYVRPVDAAAEPRGASESLVGGRGAVRGVGWGC